MQSIKNGERSVMQCRCWWRHEMKNRWKGRTRRGERGRRNDNTLIVIRSRFFFFSMAPLLSTKSSNENTTQASTVSERPLLFYVRLLPQGCTFYVFLSSISTNYKLFFISKYTFLKNTSFNNNKLTSFIIMKNMKRLTKEIFREVAFSFRSTLPLLGIRK